MGKMKFNTEQFHSIVTNFIIIVVFRNVDFEKIQGIPGIILANVVLNPNEMKAGAPKKIASRISFTDGKYEEREEEVVVGWAKFIQTFIFF